MSKKLLIIELNEFNHNLLTTAVNQYNLPNLSKILEFNKTNYKTQDRYNSGYLEPWVQWVSIHNGIPSTEHKIKHLGDVEDLKKQNLANKQMWEVLSKNNITSGVWGVMNGTRNDAKNVKFFIPDPWTHTQNAYPAHLNLLLSPLRYLSKNYCDLNKLKVIKDLFKLLFFIVKSGVAIKILQKSAKLVLDLIKLKPKHYVFISFFDYISSLIFAKYKEKYNPDCSVIFLNSLAHLQHHHWYAGEDTITDELLYGFKYIDKALGVLLNQHLSKNPQNAVIVHNGLSQMNTNHQTPWVLYRQKQPEEFLNAIGIFPQKIEQHMTHDANVYFNSQNQRDRAYEILSSVTINDTSIFHVEKNQFDSCKLFYHLTFTDKVSAKINFKVNNKSYFFFDYFKAIVTRTGRHIPMGTVLSNDIEFKDHIDNYQFNNYIYRYFDIQEQPIEAQNKNSNLNFSINLEPEILELI